MSKLYSLLNSGSVLSLFLQVIPITLLVGAIYAVYRCIRIKKHGNTVSWGTEIMLWLFVCYLTGLINLILVPANLWMFIWANVFVGYSHSELVFFSGDFNLVPIVFKLIASLDKGTHARRTLRHAFRRVIVLDLRQQACVLCLAKTAPERPAGLRVFPEDKRQLARQTRQMGWPDIIPSGLPRLIPFSRGWRPSTRITKSDVV